MIQDLPKMYQHCKETEDANLTIVDFFTDHLIDLDYIFEEKHQNNSEKPHQSHTQHQNNFSVQIITPTLHTFIPEQRQVYFIVKQKYNSSYQINYSYSFKNAIFHPPIA